MLLKIPSPQELEELVQSRDRAIEELTENQLRSHETKEHYRILSESLEKQLEIMTREKERLLRVEEGDETSLSVLDNAIQEIRAITTERAAYDDGATGT